jgi:hypothetical protein
MILPALGLLIAAACTHGSVALLMEEPYGHFGSFNPTGHAAIYLNHVCAETPTQLRACRPGELGTVISRYHKIHHEDWIAMPLVAYLYAVDDVTQVPASVDKEQADTIREAYWRAHLQELAPPKPDGSVPGGEWDQLVGESYIRKMHGFQVDTTPEQDERLIAYYNDRRNVGHFNLFVHNCADFSRALINMNFPGAVHRSILADLGITTPKQVAKSLVKYGNKHPELHMTAFVIPQVPGSIPRSHAVDGVAESVVKSKRYILPLIVLQPEFAGALTVGYLTKGRMTLPKNATIFNPGDIEQAEDTPEPAGRRPLPPDAPPIPASPATPAATPTPSPAPPV